MAMVFEPEDGSEDFYLSAKEMASLFDGDRVMARVTGIDSRGRKADPLLKFLNAAMRDRWTILLRSRVHGRA